jgi:hypothetical protein
MSTIAFRFVFSFFLFLIPATSLQAQLFGPHRVKLLGHNCSNDLSCCPTDGCLTVSSQQEDCEPIDHCQAIRQKDIELLEKYFKGDDRLQYLMTLVDSRYKRCLAGETIETVCIKDRPKNAEKCWTDLQTCLHNGHSTPESCEDQFFTCMRTLDAPGGPIEYPNVTCCQPVRCTLPSRRCFGLFNRLLRSRCR